jgi:hypothetical protein
MNQQPLFDTWKCVRILRRHHFTEQQARGLVEAHMFAANALFFRVPTRDDLKNSEFAMRADLAMTQKHLESDIAAVEHKLGICIIETRIELEAKIDAVENRLDAKIEETRIQLEAKIDAVENRLNAKIEETRIQLEAKIDAVENRLNAKIDAVENKLNAKIDAVENRLEKYILKNTIGIILINFTLMGLLVALVR